MPVPALEVQINVIQPRRGDEVVATIQKALVNFLGDHFTFDLAGGDQLSVTGDWIGREFHVTPGPM